MAMSVGSISNHRIGAHVSSNSRGLARIAMRLSSGRRVNSARDDAAGLGVATNLESKIRSTRAAVRNSEKGIALAEVAETAAGEVTNALQRMRELAVQGSSSFIRPAERTTLDLEFVGMRSEISRIASTVSFGGLSLADGSVSQLLIQAGIGSASSSRIGLSLGRLTTTFLGLNITSFDLLSVTNARDTLDILDFALGSVNRTRSGLGATINRLEASINATQSYAMALTMANSRLVDADYAKETSEFAKHQILMVAGGASMLHQRGIERQALRLLG